MNWTVYIFLCDQKTFYVGMTDNLERRFFEHKNKKSFFTKKFSELTLAYTEICNTRKEAELREQQIKKWSVAKKKALIAGNKELLINLSKSFEPGEGFSVN